LNSLRRV